jgi:hypothetical protein
MAGARRLLLFRGRLEIMLAAAAAVVIVAVVE